MNGTVDKTSIKLTITSPIPATSLSTANPIKGITANTTAITLVSSLGAGNMYVYQTGIVEIINKNTEDIISSTDPSVKAFTSGADIAILPDQYITIYEINIATRNIVKYKCIKIIAGMILTLP